MGEAGRETQGLTLELLLDTLTALRPQLGQMGGLIPLLSREMEKDLAAHLGYGKNLSRKH